MTELARKIINDYDGNKWQHWYMRECGRIAVRGFPEDRRVSAFVGGALLGLENEYPGANSRVKAEIAAHYIALYLIYRKAV